MGRRHLTGAAALAAPALGLAAPAGSAVPFRVLANGPSTGPGPSGPAGDVDRAGRGSFAARPGRGAAHVAGVDDSKDALAASCAEFGCDDPLIRASSLSQHGASLSAALMREQPPPGTVRCLALFGTDRVPAVPRAALRPPYPTRAAARLARA